MQSLAVTHGNTHLPAGDVAVRGAALPVGRARRSERAGRRERAAAGAAAAGAGAGAAPTGARVRGRRRLAVTRLGWWLTHRRGLGLLWVTTLLSWLFTLTAEREERDHANVETDRCQLHELHRESLHR